MYLKMQKYDGEYKLLFTNGIANKDETDSMSPRGQELNFCNF